jgi:hypothetical protein
VKTKMFRKKKKGEKTLPIPDGAGERHRGVAGRSSCGSGAPHAELGGVEMQKKNLEFGYRNTFVCIW